MARLIRLLGGIRRQPVWRIRLFLEAVFLLAVSRMALCVLPFRFIAAFLDRPFFLRSGELSEFETQRKNVKWAVARASRVLPGETVCFPRGIAAHIMCQIRGIDTTLFYGAAVLPDRGLRAHVWLQDGATGIVGTSLADKYCVLTRFPVRSSE
jgi:hypothetical protein